MEKKPLLVTDFLDVSIHTAHLHLEWERHEPGYFSLAVFDHRLCHLFRPVNRSDKLY